jgi:3-oxoadipate enol-lactonase
LAHSLSADSCVWVDQVPLLLDMRFQVLRVDMRGHGGSSVVAGQCTMNDLANDVVMVLDKLGFDSVHFIGLSVGGMIGQCMAINHPQRLKSLIVCNTQAARLKDAAEVYRKRLIEVDKVDSLEPITDATMARWFSPGFKERRPSPWHAVRNTVAATYPEGYKSVISAMLDFDFTSMLPKVTVPSLVVTGVDDERSPPSENRRIADLIPGCGYEELPVARHASVSDNYAMFNPIMMRWLEQHR